MAIIIVKHLFLLSIVLVSLTTEINAASHHAVDSSLHRERPEDGFAGRGAGHSGALDDDDHDTHFDHESILGSRQEASEFDDLPLEEAKVKLAVLVTKMDANSDQYVDEREMVNWIMRSYEMLSREESSERFEDTDTNQDSSVSWAEHLKETYGAGDLDPATQDADTVRMVSEDRALFNAADVDGSGGLDAQEFLSFSHPEEDERMVPLLIDSALMDKDTDQDGLLSFAEYIRPQQGESMDDNSLLEEKDRFDEDFDRNGDGYLDKSEIRLWLVPDNRETASTEARHLFASSDIDEDGLLSYSEVVDQAELFVGSEATGYGEHLHGLHSEL